MQQPLLAVAIMIKNEAEVIVPTLEPFIAAGVNHFLIYDTGSTDQTIEIAETYLNSKNAIYKIKQEPFIDFSTSRNQALTLAREYFADVPFLIMPDAEWYIKNIEVLLKTCKQHLKTNANLFNIAIHMGSSQFSTARLFRTKEPIFFEGVVHEVPNMVPSVTISKECYFDVIVTAQGHQKTLERWHRDLDLLNAEYLKNPKHPRTVFYLAQTYECLEDLIPAYNYYSIRIDLPGWDEETYVAMYRRAAIAEKLAKLGHPEYNWNLALNNYHQAFGFRSHRIEPLIRIADYYWPDNPPICYLYASRAAQIPIPTEEHHCVEKLFYEYTRYEILSRSAWYVNQFHEGLEATKKALKVAPNTPHLLENKRLYEEKIKIIRRKSPGHGKYRLTELVHS